MKDKTYKTKLLAQFSLLDVSMYDNCVADVSATQSAHITTIENKKKEILKLENKIKHIGKGSKKRYK